MEILDIFKLCLFFHQLFLVDASLLSEELIRMINQPCWRINKRLIIDKYQLISLNIVFKVAYHRLPVRVLEVEHVLLVLVVLLNTLALESTLLSDVLTFLSFLFSLLLNFLSLLPFLSPLPFHPFVILHT